MMTLLPTFRSPLAFNLAILNIDARILLHVLKKRSESSSGSLSRASFSS